MTRHRAQLAKKRELKTVKENLLGSFDAILKNMIDKDDILNNINKTINNYSNLRKIEVFLKIKYNEIIDDLKKAL